MEKVCRFYFRHGSYNPKLNEYCCEELKEVVEIAADGAGLSNPTEGLEVQLDYEDFNGWEITIRYCFNCGTKVELIETGENE